MECGRDPIITKMDITFKSDRSYLSILSSLKACTVWMKEVPGIREEEYGIQNGTQNDIQIGGKHSADIFFGFYPVTSRLD